MKAELTGRMLAPTVEKQHNFSRGKINQESLRGGREEGR